MYQGHMGSLPKVARHYLLFNFQISSSTSICRSSEDVEMEEFSELRQLSEKYHLATRAVLIQVHLCTSKSLIFAMLCPSLSDMKVVKVHVSQGVLEQGRFVSLALRVSSWCVRSPCQNFGRSIPQRKLKGKGGKGTAQKHQDNTSH